MSLTLVLHPDAQAEYDEAFDWFEQLRAGSGTPFISHYIPDEMTDMCRAAGFSAVQHVSPDDLTARYFAGRTDGLRPPSAEQLIVATG